jgi:hypothetical protein
LIRNSTASNLKENVMSNPATHHKINYVEFAATDIPRAKQFYSTVFGWTFDDYGPDYVAFSAASAGIDGGFYKADPHDPLPKVAPLIVLYSQNLKETEKGITAAGGSIVAPTFGFPGGHRFHFADGLGNVVAVWSEQA